MRSLIQRMRRNPDIIAIAVLALMLGTGPASNALAPRPVSFGLHGILARPATRIVEGLRNQLHKRIPQPSRCLDRVNL